MQKEEELKSVKLIQTNLETKVERLSKELNEAKSQLCIARIKENEVEAEKLKAQAEIASLNEIANGKYFIFLIAFLQIYFLYEGHYF